MPVCSPLCLAPLNGSLWSSVSAENEAVVLGRSQGQADPCTGGVGERTYLERDRSFVPVCPGGDGASEISQLPPRGLCGHPLRDSTEQTGAALTGLVTSADPQIQFF